jgi:hypothetical protein
MGNSEPTAIGALSKALPLPGELGQGEDPLTWPGAPPWGRRINDQSLGYRARRDSAGAPLMGLGVRKRAPAVSL